MKKVLLLLSVIIFSFAAANADIVMKRSPIEKIDNATHEARVTMYKNGLNMVKSVENKKIKSQKTFKGKVRAIKNKNEAVKKYKQTAKKMYGLQNEFIWEY